MLSVLGPISGSWTSEEIHQKSELGIRVKSLKRAYHLGTDIEMSSRRNAIKVLLNEDKALALRYEHDVRIDSPTISFSSKIEIPSVMTTNIVFNKAKSSIKSDVKIKLEAGTPVHVESQVSIVSSSNSEGHYSAMVQWEKANNPEKHVKLSGTYTLHDPNHLNIQ